MTPEEVADLLKQIAARDNRRVGPATIAVWLEDIGDLEFVDCREAIGRHFRESDKWLMPVHIRRHVSAIREERRGDDSLAVYQALKAIDPVTEEEYRTALKGIRARLGSGQALPMPFQAIAAGGSDASGPSEKYQEIRKEKAEQRQAALLASARATDVDWSSQAACESCGALADPDGSCPVCSEQATQAAAQ